MTRSLRLFLIVCFFAFTASFIVQMLFQNLGAEKSVWGGNAGWQREIAFWNVGLAVIVLLTLRLKDPRTGFIVAVGCTCLFALLGLNHLWAFMAHPTAQFHWPPLALNTIGVVFGLRVILQTHHHLSSLETEGK